MINKLAYCFLIISSCALAGNSSSKNRIQESKILDSGQDIFIPGNNGSDITIKCQPSKIELLHDDNRVCTCIHNGISYTLYLEIPREKTRIIAQNLKNSDCNKMAAYDPRCL
ncbi:MAG: hypothetical protein AB8G05_19985 [Oligoflexales bacterium]